MVFISCLYVYFFFKQKTAYEMLISDWSSDVCSSDLAERCIPQASPAGRRRNRGYVPAERLGSLKGHASEQQLPGGDCGGHGDAVAVAVRREARLGDVQHFGKLRLGARGRLAAEPRRAAVGQIGRASCRERVCPYG